MMKRRKKSLNQIFSNSLEVKVQLEVTELEKLSFEQLKTLLIKRESFDHLINLTLNTLVFSLEKN